MIVVKKIGISFNGPSIVLMYEQNGNMRKREMPLRDLKIDSDCRTVVNKIKQRHKKYLETISDIRLEKLVMLTREHLKGVGLEMGLKNVESFLKVDPEENMNILTDIELKRRKEIMDLTFEKNSIGKGHPDFVYDKQIEFKPSKDAGGWDDESDDEETPRNANAASPELSADEVHDEEDFW